jgi:hypothetical protein
VCCQREQWGPCWNCARGACSRGLHAARIARPPDHCCQLENGLLELLHRREREARGECVSKRALVRIDLAVALVLLLGQCNESEGGCGCARGVSAHSSLHFESARIIIGTRAPTEQVFAGHSIKQRYMQRFLFGAHS